MLKQMNTCQDCKYSGLYRYTNLSLAPTSSLRPSQKLLSGIGQLTQELNNVQDE